VTSETLWTKTRPVKSGFDFCHHSRVRLSFLRAPAVDPLRSRPVATGRGRNIGVYEYGDPNGRPIIALHGTPSCGAGFDWTDAPARERGLRVIAPDRPGIGHSDPAPMSSVAEYATDVEALADALAIERFVVLGYSGGGPYALAVAHRLASRVESAVIVASAGEIGAWARWKDLSRSDRQLTWISLHTPVVARALLRLADVGARLVPTVALWSAEAEMSKSDRQVMRSLGSTEALALFTQALAGSTAGAVDDYALLARPWHVTLSEITVPVHCWHGTADNSVPLAHTEALLERIPHARLTTWPEEGHLALITHVAEVLDDIVGSPG
jgi:pimeloyl-ACP methyl ester carboxylesterase